METDQSITALTRQWQAYRQQVPGMDPLQCLYPKLPHQPSVAAVPRRMFKFKSPNRRPLTSHKTLPEPCQIHCTAAKGRAVQRNAGAGPSALLNDLSVPRQRRARLWGLYTHIAGSHHARSHQAGRRLVPGCARGSRPTLADQRQTMQRVMRCTVLNGGPAFLAPGREAHPAVMAVE